MDFNELRRINETVKLVKQAQQIQQLLRLSAALKQINDIRRRQEAIQQFCEENKDQFWRGEKPSEQELEILREKTGYDKQVWDDIVRQLSERPAAE